MKRHTENGIFESVEFLNEGVGAFLLGGLLLAAGVEATVFLIRDTINDSKDKRMIKQALKAARESNEDIDAIDKRIKNIRVFSREKFLEQDFVKEEDKYKLKSAPVSIYCAVDKDDKIIAYTIYESKAGSCLFGLADTHLKPDAVEYLKVLFEYRMGLKGEHTKKFLKITKFNHPYGYLGKGSPITTVANYNDLTDEEKYRLDKDMKKLSSDFISFVKAKMSGCNVEVDDDRDNISIHIYDKNEPIMRDGTVRNQSAYDKYWASSAPQEFLDRAGKVFKEFCKTHNLSIGKSDTAIGTKDNYPYIIIARNDNPDDFLTADFDIYTSFS